MLHNYDGGELEVSEEGVKEVAKQTPMDFTSCVKTSCRTTGKRNVSRCIKQWHALLLSWHDEVDIVCALQCKGGQMHAATDHSGYILQQDSQHVDEEGA